MTIEEARTILKRLTAAATDPMLDDPTIDALLTLWSRPDAAGVMPDDAAWQGAYNLRAAAADGWRTKAAQVAADFGFTADGGSYQREQMVAQCLKMAAIYDAPLTSKPAKATV